MSRKRLAGDRAPVEHGERGDASRSPLRPETAASVVAAIIAVFAAQPRLSGAIVGVAVALVASQLRPSWRRWPLDRRAVALVSCLAIAGGGVGFVLGPVVADGESRANQPPSGPRGPTAAYSLLPAVAGDRALRVAFQPTAPEMFLVAFQRDVGKPAEGTGWRQLHEQGGVDVSASTFALTLTNRTQLPLAVTNIVAEVIASEPAPSGWLGGMFSQGVGNLDHYVASLESEASGDQAVFRLSEQSNGTYKSSPFFATRQITLKPGEIYDASVSIKTHIARELRYRFLVSGNTASESFTLDVSPKGGYRLSGEREQKYAHTYGMSVAGCWRTPAEELRELDGHDGPCKQG